MRKLVLMFTGQGSHHAEMFSKLEHEFMRYPITKQILGDNFIDKLKQGPEPLPTSFTQPLIALQQLSLFNRFSETLQQNKIVGLRTQAVLGHSLGEFTAVTVAGGFKFAEVMELVHKRGLLMENETKKFTQPTAMIALIRPPSGVPQFLSQQTDLVCDVANINSPEQIVLSGYEKDVKEAILRMKKHFGDDSWKQTKSIPLKNIGTPFHSRLLEPVSRSLLPSLEKYLDREEKTKFNVITNFDGEAINTFDELIDPLSRQTHSTVQWDKCVKKAFEIVRAQSVGLKSRIQFVEIGPKQVLIPLLKKSLPYEWSTAESPTSDLRADFIGNVDDIERVVSGLSNEIVNLDFEEDEEYKEGLTKTKIVC